MAFRAKYGLADMTPGETKRFFGLTPQERGLVKRSAHNYNLRTGLYFSTRVKDNVLYVTRIR